MPGSTLSVFGEADDYQAALRDHGGFDLLVTGRGAFRAELLRIATGRMRLLAGEETLARIAFISLPPRSVRVSLPALGYAPLSWGEIALRPGAIVTHGPGLRFHERIDGASQWRTIWVPVNELAEYSRAITGAAFQVPPGECHWMPPPRALRCRSALYGNVIRAHRNRPSIAVAANRAAHGLEQQVMEALVECLSVKPDDEGAPARLRHAELMGRFEDLLRAHPGRTPPSDEIYAALNVPGRTLRACCETHLGMGPQRYLRLRRLQLAYRALRDADPAAARVSEVAHQCGFSGLGRFAAAYREQFGELPSATLERER